MTATGQASGLIATTTFTDGNVDFQLATADNAAPSTLSWTVSWLKYTSSSTCGGVSSSGSASYTGNTRTAGSSPAVGNGDSAQPTGVTATGYALNYWTTTATGTTPLTAAQLCALGPGNTTFYAHFKASDSTPPETSITAQPANLTNSASASFGFSGSDNVTPAASLTFECKLDAAAFAACTSPKSVGPLADGSHTFQVRATDSAGNVDASPASYTWTVDTVAPDTSITAKPNDPSNNTSPSFSFSSSKANSTFECKLDAAAFAACTSPKSVGPLADGSHTFQVRATDSAGNVDASPASYTWTIDTVAPTSKADAPATDTNLSPFQVTYTASDASPSSTLSKVELYVKVPGASSYTLAATDSTPSASGSFSYTLTDGQGSYSFYTKAYDQAGNAEAIPASPDAQVQVTYDTTAPVTTDDAPTAWQNGPVTVHLTRPTAARVSPPPTTRSTAAASRPARRC